MKSPSSIDWKILAMSLSSGYLLLVPCATAREEKEDAVAMRVVRMSMKGRIVKHSTVNISMLE
jgi:hypothetical protein